MKEWFTAAELADLKLPDVAQTARGVNATAKREEWKSVTNTLQQSLSRRREGRGGGYEYHYSLLPSCAQLKLTADARRSEAKTTGRTRQANNANVTANQMWSWFEALPSKKKEKAEYRLSILESVKALVRGGVNKNFAVEKIAEAEGISSSTIWGWSSKVDGVDRADWLPYLAPKHTGRTETVECHPKAWAALKADYLRKSQPPFEACFERVRELAEQEGWSLPSSRTLERRLKSEIPKAVMVHLRQGADKLKEMYPPQERDRSMFHALEAVNIDGHKWDVFVKWPDGSVSRPLMVAIQDLYSNKCLAWRIDKSENSDMVRLVIADTLRDFGIFEHIYMDNGRAFASKCISGGTPNRYRFKVKPEEPSGILTTLGIQITWTRPYSGQSKPIERMFREFCDHIAKHPAFEGAYTGNKPDAKPENYGTRAIPLDEFVAVVEQGIRLHNARPNRRTRVCAGKKSFDQVFNESYSEALIRKCGPDQLRMCLMAAENVRTDRRSGAIRLLDNRYWDECLHDHIGQAVTVRFDPDNLHEEVHVYRLDGSFIGSAECIEAAGFGNSADARTQAQKFKRFKRATKEAAEIEQSMSLDEYVRMLPDVEDAPKPETKLIRMVAGNTALKPALDDEQETETDPYSAEDFREHFSQGLRLIETDRDL